MARNKTPPFLKKGNDRQFVMLYSSLLKSNGYMNLSNGAKVLFIDMLSLFNPAKALTVTLAGESRTSNEYFNYTFSLAKSKHITQSKETFYLYIKELTNAGFIELILSGQNTRTANIYKYSDKWKDK